MSQPVDENKRKELLKSAYRKIEELRGRLADRERIENAPVAITGMACRFPGGVADPEAFWQLLSSGVDGVVEIPRDRWNIDDYYDPDPDAPGKMYSRRGGFIDNVRGFDPLFFHLSPQEASAMEPQQRVLLEVSWEAIENAGYAPDRLAGSRTGVFVGMATGDYFMLGLGSNQNLTNSNHGATGSSPSVAAGRLSYFYGLRGPCMAVDTACASALTAVHLAVQSLRRGESSMALAGSVNLIVAPFTSVAISKARMLSPEGQCKTFDAAANGYVRSEGCGVLVLKLLSQAEADGDRVLAVIRGTACNQDGRTNGITAPNGNAQREVILAALAASGVKPGDIDYLETHGTGTSLGDPIEIQALGEVFAQDRPAGRNLVLGAVKSNIGHLETAAGMASMAKVILALQRRQIPPNLHFSNPNPLIPWKTLPFTVPTQVMPWPAGGRGLAGISAFGFSGTNIHLVVEQAPELTARTAEPDRALHLFTLSAQSPKALAELAARYNDSLAAPADASLGDICFTANSGRAHLSHRIAIVASTLEELKLKLDQCDPLHARRAPVQPPQLTLLIQPEPLTDFHRQLYRLSPVFKAAIDACNAAALDLLGVSIPPAVWTGPAPAGAPADALLAFALAHAMAAQWLDWGLNPATVAGAGAGSCAAAVLAGAITLRDGLSLATGRQSTANQRIAWTDPRIALVSSRTGLPLTAASLNEPAEWTAAGAGRDVFDSGGKHVVLVIGSKPETGLPCIEAPTTDWSSVLGAMGNLFVAGIAVDWEKIERPWHRRRVALPSYPFQRQECWLKIDPAASRSRSARKEEHPLLGHRVHSAQLREEIVFEAEFDLTALPFVQDHTFFGTPVFPGSAMLEMAAAAGRIACRHANIGVNDLVIEEPLLLPAGQTRLVQTVLTPAEGDGFSFTILSADAGELDDAPVWKRHCSGRLVRVESPAGESATGVLEDLRARYQKPVDPDKFYADCSRLGLEYGPTFRLARNIVHGDDGLLVRLEMPADTAREPGYGIHPGLLDSVLQSIGILGGLVRNAKDPYMPVAIGSFRLHGPVPDELWCHSHFEAGPEDSPVLVFGDARFYSSSGELVGELLGVQFKRNSQREFSRELEERRLAHWLFEPVWETLPALPRIADAAGAWLILSQGDPVATELANELRGRHGLIVPADSGTADHPESCDAMIAKVLESGAPLRGVVLVAASNSGMEPAGIASSVTAQLLNLTQALARKLPGELETLALVTKGFQSPGIGNASSIGSAAAWGLGRTIAAELPGLHCKLIDLDPALSAQAAAPLLADEFGSGSDENQVAIGEGKRLALRLSQPGASYLTTPSASSSSRDPVELVFDARGDFRQLRFAPQHVTPPGPGEVQLRVLATAMNFRDVLNVLGMYPGDPGPVGVECVGEIVALGPEVSGWSIGQRVLAMPYRGYCTFTNSRADLMFPCPPNLSLPEAATLLVGYLTAAYALCHLGGMKAGDRVLIHAATGGVGLAAVQLAQRAGAEIFATAGSPAKREYLRQIGVRHIMDSRSLGFAEEIRELTGGEGVDLVLNSLTGAALAQGIALLRPGGHFLEIGKNELLSAEQVAALNAGAQYHVIDLREPFTQAPETIRAVFAAVIDSLASGVLRPLPYRAFDLTDAPKAFRYMSAARHIGKVIVLDRSVAPAAIEPGGAYLITGGLGGLGLQVARWMVNEGARNLVLVGRRASNANAEAVIAELEALGAKITPVQADIGDREQVAALLATHTSTSAPLRGIIHAAGVLDDGVLLSQDWSRFERVFRPKVAGAWNLHELTLGIPLDFFVLFASGAGLIGNAGQSNYSAANAFLDALAQARQAAGLPALSIDWGAWADAGMAATLDERHAKNWSATGVTVIRPEQGLAILGRLLGKRQSAQMAVLPIADTAWRKPAGQAIPPLFRTLANDAGIKPEAAPANTVNAMERLRAAGSGEKRAVLIELITEIVLDTFGLDRSRSIPPDQNLTMLGMDSLLAIQLSNRLKTNFGSAVPSTLTFQYPTIEDIADYLLETLSTADAPSAPAPVAIPLVDDDQELDAEQAQKLLANLDQLSDEEVEALLGAIETNSGSPL